MTQRNKSEVEQAPSFWSRVLRGHENDDLPVDDPPPAEHPSENYQAWSHTAIYGFVPFSSPTLR